MSTFDRVRFYDGEFLRAFDFSDEQSYHVEMRRRLNRHLHLHGIVYGLQLQEDEDATGVSIMPGLAIDAFGREIYMFSPYTLGETDRTTNRISRPVPHDVWLQYRKNASTPPAGGYGACNQTNQYTRWTETYRVVLLPSPSKPFTDPQFADDDLDDPDQDKVGVLLGIVSVDPKSSSAIFYGPTVGNRHFVGIIAQRIRTPLPYDAAESFNFQNKQEPRQPAASLEIEPNIFAKQNLILGPDFDLAVTPPGKPADPPFTSSPSGSAKLAGDLVVQGNIYSQVADASGNLQWMGLQSYVKQLVQQGLPDIASGKLLVSVPASGEYSGGVGGTFSGTAQVPVTMNRLKSFSFQQVMVSFSQIETTSQINMSALFKTSAQIQLQIIGVPQFAFSGATATGNVSVSWLAQPGANGTPGMCAIDNFTVSCWVMLFP